MAFYQLMKMKGGIDHDTPLDYVELQIFPSQNRYEACVCSSSRAERVASGTLEPFLLHSPRVKDLSSKGLNTNFKILPPDNINNAEWFTTATLIRFLHIVGSSDILNIGNEIAQLEETRKFQLSLSVKAEVDITSSIDSKNELLRAVDLRLTALKEELAATFNQATGARCSTKDISDLENFAHHFGAKDIRDSLQRFVDMSLFPTDDENSSFSSEEDQPSVERSRARAPTRSATPRRSASPMRRIQIGRSGSHRAAALTIRSLNYFPAREKVVFQRDTADGSSDEDHPEKPPKNNVLRMSVQDKISLFESKQRDQGVDVPKTKLNTTAGANKAVLRRWSSGMRESATRNLPDNNSETSQISPEIIAPEVESNSRILSQVSADSPKNTLEPETEENCEKHPDSIEWSQQKEAELSQLFMKMMENKPVDHIKKSPTEQKGVFYDHYKQKRDEKLLGEASGKRAEKETQIKVMQHTMNKPQKTQKNSVPLMNPKKETSKPTVLKKAESKTSLPATRKSWPSGTSPARTPTGPTSSNSRKLQSASSLSSSSAAAVRSSTKSEKSKPRSNTPKATPPDANKNLKNAKEKKQPKVTKSTKTTKAKVQTPEADTAKPSFYNKVTKKSSVVPVETKPFLRKGSGIKTKIVAQLEETSRSSEILIQDEDNEVVMTTDISKAPEIIEPQMVSVIPTKCEESPSSDQINVSGENDFERVELSEISTGIEEELMISPTAWVEVEEHHDEEIILCTESPVQTVSPPATAIVPAGTSSPRVRHSLSQMLLEESSEADIGGWGNAEHPPALVYQKDSPKGFKRLLKFARKTKADSAFSEGDDEAEELKGQANISRFTSQNHRKVSDGRVSASANTTKATRSFFSLSTFRGSKTNETKLP